MRWLPNGPRGEAEWEGDEPGGPEGPEQRPKAMEEHMREGRGRVEGIDGRLAGWLILGDYDACCCCLSEVGRPSLTEWPPPPAAY